MRKGFLTKGGRIIGFLYAYTKSQFKMGHRPEFKT